MTINKNTTADQDLLVKPTVLDKSVIHSPDAIATHKRLTAAYFDALDEIQREKQRKEQHAQTHANRALSSDEYYQLALELDKEQKARDKQLADAEAASARAHQAYLDSRPEFVDVSASNPHAFLVEFSTRLHQGYELVDLDAMLHNYCHATLKLVEPKAKKKNAESEVAA